MVYGNKMVMKLSVSLSFAGVTQSSKGETFYESINQLIIHSEGHRQTNRLFTRSIPLRDMFAFENGIYGNLTYFLTTIGGRETWVLSLSSDSKDRNRLAMLNPPSQFGDAHIGPVNRT